MTTVPPSADFLTQHASILVFLATIVGLHGLRPRPVEGAPPGALRRGEDHDLRVRRGAGRERLDPVQHPLLRLRPHLHRVRRGGGVPAALGRRLPRAGARSPTSRGSSSSASWRWPSPTSGARATSPGCVPRTGPDGRHVGDQGPHPQPLRRRAGVHERRPGHQLEPQEQHLVHDLRPRLLRHRDDGHRRQPLRPGPLRRHARAARRARPT